MIPMGLTRRPLSGHFTLPNLDSDSRHRASFRAALAIQPKQDRRVLTRAAAPVDPRLLQSPLATEDVA